MVDFWTSGNKQIPYSDLTDDHLMNIIVDGYRNPHLQEEADKRGFMVPLRTVDQLTPQELVNAEVDLVNKLIEIEGLNQSQADNARGNMQMTKAQDYQTYLIVINRFLDDRDESLWD